MIVHFPDGYQGDVVALHAKPIRIDGNMALLRCAEHGREHLIRWVRMNDLEAKVSALEDRMQRHQPVTGIEIAEIVERELASACT